MADGNLPDQRGEKVVAVNVRLKPAWGAAYKAAPS